MPAWRNVTRTRLVVRSEAGGARLGLLLMVVAAAFCWGGIQGIYIAAQNQEPLRLTMGDYLQASGATRGKPDAAWLELRDAVAYIPWCGAYL